MSSAARTAAADNLALKTSLSTYLGAACALGCSHFADGGSEALGVQPVEVTQVRLGADHGGLHRDTQPQQPRAESRDAPPPFGHPTPPLHDALPCPGAADGLAFKSRVRTAVGATCAAAARGFEVGGGVVVGDIVAELTQAPHGAERGRRLREAKLPGRR